MTSKPTGLLSAEELMKYRETLPSTLPDAFKKDEICSKEKLKEFYDVLEQVLQEERVAKSGSLSQAEFDWATKKIHLTKQCGKFWQKMGHTENGEKYLYPEEAIFLMEMAALEIYCNKVPLSLQEVYAVLIQPETCSLEQYQTYAHLNRLGYIVIRYKELSKDKLQEKTNSTIEPQPSVNNGDDAEAVTENDEVTSTSTQVISSDDEQDTGISIVYESIPRKRCKTEDDVSEHEDVPLDNGELEVDSPSTSNKTNCRFDFPNVAGLNRGYYKLPMPPLELLPPNIDLTESMCTIDLEALWNCRNERQDRYRQDNRNRYHNNFRRNQRWERRRPHHQDNVYCEPSSSTQRVGYLDFPHYSIQNVSDFDNQLSCYANNVTSTNNQYSEPPPSSNHFQFPPREYMFNVFESVQSNDITHQKMFSAFGSGMPLPLQSTPEPCRTRSSIICNQRREYSRGGHFINDVARWGARNWKEYKHQLGEKREVGDLHYTQLNHLWTCTETPLLEPKEALNPNSVLCQLQCIRNEEFSNIVEDDETTTLKLVYDVHLPAAIYKKSNPPQPNHRVVIVRSADGVPDLPTISLLQNRSGNVPIHFALFDNGSISFHSFTNVTLPLIDS